MRYLALDVGDRRIGLAVGDDRLGLVRPLPTVRRKSLARDLILLGEVARREEVAALVIGMPLTLRGEVGYQGARVQRFADAARVALALPLCFADERFTTAEAAARGATDLDAGAATVLLEAFFREGAR